MSKIIYNTPEHSFTTFKIDVQISSTSAINLALLVKKYNLKFPYYNYTVGGMVNELLFDRWDGVGIVVDNAVELALPSEPSYNGHAG